MAFKAATSELGMKRFTFLLRAMVLAVSFLISDASRAAMVTFQASMEAVQEESPVTVAFTVSDFTEVTTFQFTIEWNPAVIQFSSIGDFGLPDLASNDFTVSETPGKLWVSWEDEDLMGETLADESLIFHVNFMPVGGSAGNSTDILFTDDPTPREVSVDLAEADFNSINGHVSVVPEPVNVALGLFAGVFVSSVTLRWISSRRRTQKTT